MSSHTNRTRRTALLAIAGGASAAYFVGKRAKPREIPFLITVDVHPRPNVQDELSRCLDAIGEFGFKVTFLLTANITRQGSIGSVLNRVLKEGHQIGCHGHDHDGDEDYMTNSVATQREHLATAKRLIEDCIKAGITTFRAPSYRISKDTLSLLDALSFKADLSVCSQRLPVLSSQLGNYHWLLAPRTPYHPSATNPYAKGDLRILEIPTSAACLPLMSSLNSVSVAASKALTIILRDEATLLKKPIVYQCHPEDFICYKQPRQAFNLTWRSLIPSSRYGIPARWAFAETDGDSLFRRNQEFLNFLKQARAFHFQTVDGYMQSLGSSSF
jgi:peptidoglycan/xylan/chitin deacetylase (PgdA/CDA1 family)